MSEPNPIYLKDLIDPRRRVSQAYFGPLMLLAGVLVFLIYIGVPALFIAGAMDDDGNPVPADATVAFANIGYLICGALLSYLIVVACVNRLRAAGLNAWLLLVPGYNIFLLFTAPDIP